MFLDLIPSENLNNPIMLPNSRNIYEKCELINKYFEFYRTQILDFNLNVTELMQNNYQQNSGNNI